MTKYLFEEEGLFTMERPRASTLLRDRYGQPPFTTLERRGGDWLERDARWKSLGIRGELGREAALNFAPPQVTYKNWYEVKNVAEVEVGRRLRDAELISDFGDRLEHFRSEKVRTSVFSPALCEVVYRWLTSPGHHVLDPFAGGSVRGVVAGAMGRHYTGVELRPEQVAANREQGFIVGDGPLPTWVVGDARETLPDLDVEADLVFSCPPYVGLEAYSDDPRDLSGMDYPDFLVAYRAIIAEAVERLRPDRFAAWVVGEVRKQDTNGALVGLVADTVHAFQDAGAEFYNDHVLLTPIGTAAVRAARTFNATRKAARTHEYLLVFVKGDARRATAAADGDD